MVFKRRQPKTFALKLRHFIWPNGGWGRAAHYFRHRLSRLPATPEEIGRGISAGVFAAFTPFYGLHFLLAVILARVIRGNIFAAAIGTLFGNPLTYVPIGIVCFQLGNAILGRPATTFGSEEGMIVAFSHAGGALWHNFLALFSHAEMEWALLARLWGDFFLPYAIGGVAPGLVAALASYWLVVPLIRAYKARRAGAARRKRKMRVGPLPQPARADVNDL